MTEADKRRETSGLAWNVLPAMAGVLAVNALVFGLGWVRPEKTGSGTPEALPGGLIGAVWVGLFVMMGVARWCLLREPRESSQGVRAWIAGLMVSCLAWPFDSLATDNASAGLIGNLGIIALASFVAGLAIPRSKVAASLILPVAAWVTFATFVAFGPHR
jgi:tryptophan-rich sensory protein